MTASPLRPTQAVQARRGEVWWVNMDPTAGAEIRQTRPSVVLTADGLNRARKTIVIVPLSTSAVPRPPIVIATPSAGPDSAAVCDQLRAVDRSRLTQRIGKLSLADLRSVELAVRTVLQL